DYFDSSQEVSARLLSNLSTQLQSIVDQKLMLPLEHRKMELAESWRSRRSLRNIQLNLQALEDLYSTGFSGSVTDAKLDAEIRQSFRDAITSLEAIHLPLYRIQANTEADQKLQHVLESCRRLKRLINNQLPPTIGMTLGFNSLDGD
ncbi:MAG: imelysin family protein, partial [Gammaproteobacteria bacterium]